MGAGLAEKMDINPIIAAVRDTEALKKALQSPCEIIFLLSGSIFDLSSSVNMVHENDKSVFVHVDLVDGFSKDATALSYIQQTVQPDGILTTRNGLVKAAKELGLPVIQRFFMIDSLSIETAVKAVHTSRPDAIEIMPGILPGIIGTFHERVDVPIIGGGLVSNKEEIITCLGAGAMGVSTSAQALWYI